MSPNLQLTIDGPLKVFTGHQQQPQKMNTRAENAPWPKIRICLIRCEHIYIPGSPGKVPMFNMGAIGAPEMAKSIFYVHPIQIDLSITIYVLWKSNWPMAILLVKHL